MAGSTTGKSVVSGVIGQAGMCAEGRACARGGLTRFSEGCFRQLMEITQPACPAKPPTVQLFLYRILPRRSSLQRILGILEHLPDVHFCVRNPCPAWWDPRPGEWAMVALLATGL